MGTTSIGIVICNYNKRNYVVNCIQSVLESDTSDFSVYVVDNGSTDDSVEQMRIRFGERIQILKNKENLGGSGGFNRGIREALKAGHPYIMCLDNDVLVDEAAVSSLYRCMQEHPEIGMLASRVYHMEEPDYVQQFGLNIDFRNYILDTLYENAPEDGTIPELIDCDTAATCSVMVRAKAVRRAGMMPEENFIYWDDVEWGFLIRKSGYKVAAFGKSKVLHTKGAGNRNSAVFTGYYSVRNRIRFFMKYIREEQIEDFAKKMLSDVFDAVYERMYRDEHHTALAILYALEDAMQGISGKAADEKLRTPDTLYNGLEELFCRCTGYCIEENGYAGPAEEIRAYMREKHPDILEKDPQESDVVLSLCDYIMNVKDFSLKKVYVDIYDNVFSKVEEAELIKNYSFSRELFLYMHLPLFVDHIRKQRKKK